MTEASVITEEMKAWIGREGPPTTVEVEKGAIRKFARAIGDPNPLWNDELAARKAHYGGIIAPPTFLCCIRTNQPIDFDELPYPRILNGGGGWEHFEPIYAGDRITAVSKFVDLRERQGRLGNMFIITIETTYTNQFSQKVAVSHITLINY